MRKELEQALAAMRAASARLEFDSSTANMMLVSAINAAEAALAAPAEHISSPDCWCEPTVEFSDPDTGATVWVHKDRQ